MRRSAQIQGLTQSRGEGKLSWLRAQLGEPGEEQGRRKEKPQNATVRRGHFQGQLSLSLPQLKGPEISETQQAKPALHGKVYKTLEPVLWRRAVKYLRICRKLQVLLFRETHSHAQVNYTFHFLGSTVSLKTPD